ncbi:MAG: site-specific DNA-methyltransferase [Syntrophales bacterium]|nr:site-specific DNA-methyltransferase [Syntrophales bacterium]
MPKNNLTPDDKIKLIEALNKGVEPSPDLLPKLFPGTAEKFDVQALDRAKIPTLEYSGKRSKATILAEAGAGIGAAPLQNVRCFGDIKNGDWRNLIVQGDNLQFLKTAYRNVDPLIKNMVKGKVKLIYIDPPFATKSEFGGKEGQRSYADKVDASEFIESLRERLIYLRELLADDGSIYVHLDQKMSHYAKTIMDEIFGKESFVNEIIWHYQSGGRSDRFFAHKHDNLLWYSRSKSWVFNLDAIGIERGTGKKNNMKKQVDTDGRTFFSIKSNGKIYKYYEDEKVAPDDVWDISHLQQKDPERIKYPTQKPERLLERIVLASSNIEDLVLDCFSGSGTTAAVAEKLGRRWIACDFGKHAIYTMQRRMLRIGESKALVDEQDKSGKVIVKKGDPYKKAAKPFCIISSGAYDFSHVMDLRKHKDTYIDFVLGLFQLARNEDKAKKYKLANIYALKDGDPVEVYPVWDDQFLKEVKIDEEYLRGIIAQSGGRLKGDYFIITPESCANVGDTVVKNPDGKDVNFQILTFPYKVLEDISRALELQEQPSSQDNVNNLITSTAFYFNEDVKLKAKRVKGGLQITKFETKILNKEGKRFDGFSGFAMILVDMDYEAGKPFDMDVTVFAKEIGEDGLVKIDGLTKSVGLIAIDKHGNESKPFELD